MRVAVVGAGIVGAATARALARRGVEVELIDAGEVSGGTTGLGEGNVLCSDKDAGPELDLAVLGRAAYDEIEARLRRAGADPAQGRADRPPHRGRAGRRARADRAPARGRRGVRAARARPGARARARRSASCSARPGCPATSSATRARSPARWPRSPGSRSGPTPGSRTSAALRADEVVLAAGPVERGARAHRRAPPPARAAQGPARPARAGGSTIRHKVVDGGYLAAVAAAEADAAGLDRDRDDVRRRRARRLEPGAQGLRHERRPGGHRAAAGGGGPR